MEDKGRKKDTSAGKESPGQEAVYLIQTTVDHPHLSIFRNRGGGKEKKIEDSGGPAGGISSFFEN